MWGQTEEEMLKDAKRAAGGATAIAALFGVKKLLSITSKVVRALGGFGAGGSFGTQGDGSSVLT